MALAVLPDNRIAINLNRHVEVYDLGSGRHLQTLEGHNDDVQCLAVLPDGRIASGGGDEVKVWNLVTGEHETFQGHTDKVWCLTVLPNGNIASGSKDKYVKVWDVTSGPMIGGVQSLRGHTNSVICIAGLPNGSVVSGSRDKTVKLWDLKGGVKTFKGHTGVVSCVLGLSNGSIVSGDWDKTVFLWNPDDRTIRKFEGQPFMSLCQLPNGSIVGGCEDGDLIVWNLESGSEQIIDAHEDSVDCVDVFPDGRIVSGSLDYKLKVWEYKDISIPVVKLGYKTFPTGTRLFTLITSETFDRTRDLAFFGKHLGLNVRATLHNTIQSNNLWLHVFNTTGPLRMLTAPKHWRQAIYGSAYIRISVLEKRLTKYCQDNGYDGWHMRVKIDNRVSNVKEAEYETVVLRSSFDKLQFRGKKKITLEDLKDKDHVRVSKNGKITFVKRIERLEEMFENLRF